LKETVEWYREVASKLAEWMEENIADGLMVLVFPQAHWRLLRTTNGLERLSQEISHEWKTGRAYLTFPEETPYHHQSEKDHHRLFQIWMLHYLQGRLHPHLAQRLS
jgi:hypothetical protein